MLTHRLATQSRSLLTNVLILLIETYRLALRPLLIGACKFHPTCSEYAEQALRLHGPWRGSRLAAKRLLRCHPFTPGGIDPVPHPDTI
jgi:putative membrane protein insertion efficiency factor